MATPPSHTARRPLWPLILLAVATLGWLTTALLWQSSKGWSVQVVGSAGQWFGSFITTMVLAFTIYEVFSERKLRLQKEIDEQEIERVEDAAKFTIWPTRQTNEYGKPIGWAIAIQNDSKAPIFNWQATVTANGQSDNQVSEFQLTSVEFGAIPPAKGRAVLHEFSDAGNKAGLTFHVSATWFDVRGINWVNKDGLISRVQPVES